MSEQTSTSQTTNQTPQGCNAKSERDQIVCQILEKKRSEIIRNALKGGVPEIDLIRAFSLIFQPEEIKEHAIFCERRLLGFSVDELKVAEVKLDVYKEYYYQYNQVKILLTTPYENVVELTIVSGRIKVPKEIEAKLAPIIEEIKFAKKEQELDQKEKQLKEKEEKLMKREQELKQRERELDKREDELRSKQEKLEQLAYQIVDIVGLNCYDEEDP